MGLWKGDVLSAVVGWKEESPSEWHSVVTAVRTGHVGHGLGRRLKDELLALASAEGVEFVISWIHRDNAAMIHINAGLGGEMVLDPNDPQNYLLCTIPVPKRS